MYATRQTCRAAAKALVLGAFTVALTAVPAVATTAGTAQAARAGVFSCREVSAQLPDVFARSCDTTHWGPVSDFVIRDSNSGVSYFCRSGWAEGALWINGQNCRQLPA
ncbi:hypothetical protein [Nonomuraea sp. WAC 01424]|uniref:hypothetical protein n=1 Tax=Nonomuraea sp. WAC 01424 TaxID=2203200 RepID=UPI000F786348|nr:hypothetical protein [Nonomuraea sp. WAC 01424]